MMRKNASVQIAAKLNLERGNIMSTKSTISHQWDEGFSLKQARGWPGLTSLSSLCFKDSALQIASEFLSKSGRIQIRFGHAVLKL